jgi:hypothetical protein
MNKIVVFGLILLFSLQACEKNNAEIENDREVVIMRKIGHEILLQSNDSTSLVHPIIKKGNTYRIQFGSDLAFKRKILLL